MKAPSKIKISIIIVLIIAFFTVLNLSNFANEVKNFFYFISAPIQKTLWQAGINVADFFETIAEIRELEQKNRELELGRQELLARIALLRELKKENEILREALNIGLQQEFELIFAWVVSKDIFQDSILINKGFKHGLEKGMSVITQEKVLVGKISQVYRNFSRVILISNKDKVFPAKISEKDILGTIEGRGNLQMALGFIPHQEQVNQGDLIVTTVLDRVFPKGLLVGQVIEIEPGIGHFQQIRVKPIFNLEKIKAVFVISQ
ncbi:MAG: rod shape-determining protein MreC [Candidatus Nealsonbacteria bacterium]|nr:rod shape-determining protein MreC [Candidatus Nealsonbacteria bacterium]